MTADRLTTDPMSRADQDFLFEFLHIHFLKMLNEGAPNNPKTTPAETEPRDGGANTNYLSTVGKAGTISRVCRKPQTICATFNDP